MEALLGFPLLIFFKLVYIVCDFSDVIVGTGDDSSCGFVDSQQVSLCHSLLKLSLSLLIQSLNVNGQFGWSPTPAGGFLH